MKAKKIWALLMALAMVFSLAACGATETTTPSSNTEPQEKTTIKMGSGGTYADMIEKLGEMVADQGYDVELVLFDSNSGPADACSLGDIDAFIYNHEPWLEQYNKDNGTDFVVVSPLYYGRTALYSVKYDSLDQLPDGATIAVPNDATNEARALLLLQDAGLITLKDDAGINATVNDIVSNPKNLQFKEVEAATVPSIVADVDLACINGNYAIPAGFKTTDALATESATSLAAEAYANVLVVKDGNQDSDKIKALVKALTSDEVRTYINDTYAGAVVPVF